jgi:CRP-like cAMP-binding protein
VDKIMFHSPTECSHCPSKDLGIFCGLHDPELQELADHKIENTYKKGQTLFMEGNPTYGIFCISKGNIKIFKNDENGQESIVRIATSGDVVGHRSLFSEEHYSATATALEDSEICFIDKKYILQLIEKNPNIALNLIQKLSKDLGQSENKIASFSTKNVREKFAEFLIVMGKTHGIIQNGKRKISLKLTREEMASIVGTATETLIRILSDFKKEGLIELDGKFIILENEKEILKEARLKN